MSINNKVLDNFIKTVNESTNPWFQKHHKVDVGIENTIYTKVVDECLVIIERFDVGDSYGDPSAVWEYKLKLLHDKTLFFKLETNYEKRIKTDTNKELWDDIKNLFYKVNEEYESKMK